MEFTGACSWGRAGSRAGHRELGQGAITPRPLPAPQRPLEVVLSKGAGPLHACVNRSPDTGWGGATPSAATVGGHQRVTSPSMSPLGREVGSGGCPTVSATPLSFFFSFIFISWRLITLQYCSGFCHTLT